MADRKRNAKDVGSDSPPSKVAKQQQMAGASGGPQQAKQRPKPENEKQPPQTSNRRGAAHEHDPQVEKGYQAAQNPERQGDGDPSPRTLKGSSTNQGIAGGAGGRGRSASRERGEETAQSGEPQGRHTRHGRQHAPGDRDPQQPS